MNTESRKIDLYQTDAVKNMGELKTRQVPKLRLKSIVFILLSKGNVVFSDSNYDGYQPDPVLALVL